MTSEAETIQLHSRNVPLATLIEHQQSWSRSTFGPGDRLNGLIEHIKKELREVANAANEGEDTLDEWVDVFILASDALWRTGHSIPNIVRAIKRKMQINAEREWPDWRGKSQDEAIEHVRGTVLQDGICLAPEDAVAAYGAEAFAAIGGVRAEDVVAVPKPTSKDGVPDGVTHYVHWNGSSTFVKEAGYFVDQGGLREQWGRTWRGVKAPNIEAAREMILRGRMCSECQTTLVGQLDGLGATRCADCARSHR